MTNEELVERLNKVSDAINKASRDKGDYIIVSPQIAELIENLDIKKHRIKKIKQIEKRIKNDET